jgi:hypothetical protein
MPPAYHEPTRFKNEYYIYNISANYQISSFRIDSLGVEFKLPMCLHCLLEVRVRVSVDAQRYFCYHPQTIGAKFLTIN